MVNAYGFPRNMLPLIRCIVDKGELLVTDEKRSDEESIADGNLRCVNCSCEYKIECGIVRLMAQTLTQESEHEIRLKDEEYEAMPEVFVPAGDSWRSEFMDAIEIPPHLDAIGNLEGRRVLELGSGDGRFTILMGQLGAEVLALDFSFAALRKLSTRLATGIAPTAFKVNAPRFAGRLTERIALVQADASNFHVAPRAFHRALSATPLDSRDERMKMYCSIAEALTDNGRYVAGVEHDDLYRKLLGLPLLRRYTPGGILIEHLDIPTMRREMSPYFFRLRIRPIRAHLPFVKRLPMNIRIAIFKAAIAIPLVNRVGTLLLAVAERPRRLPQDGARRASYLGARALYRRYKRWRGEEALWSKGDGPV